MLFSLFEKKSGPIIKGLQVGAILGASRKYVSVPYSVRQNGTNQFHPTGFSGSLICPEMLLGPTLSKTRVPGLGVSHSVSWRIASGLPSLPITSGVASILHIANAYSSFFLGLLSIKKKEPTKWCEDLTIWLYTKAAWTTAKVYRCCTMEWNSSRGLHFLALKQVKCNDIYSIQVM